MPRSNWLGWCGAVISLIALAADGASAQERSAKPLFESKVITAQTPGHAVEIEADITGAKVLALVVTDGGDGYSCDWANWAKPRLIGPNGKKKLTELKWKSANTDWGQVRVNQNAAGGPLRIDGEAVEFGIGTHAELLEACPTYREIAESQKAGSPGTAGALA